MVSPYLRFLFPWFQVPWSTNHSLEADALPSDDQSIVTEQPCYSAYVIPLVSSLHTGILSSHVVTATLNTVQKDVLRKKDHIHRTFITVYRYDCSLLLLLLLISQVLIY